MMCRMGNGGSITKEEVVLSPPPQKAISGPDHYEQFFRKFVVKVVKLQLQRSLDQEDYLDLFW